MKSLKNFYLQVTNIKLYMALYFSGLLFLVGLLYFIQNQLSISLFVLLQILIVGLLISLLQAILLPDSLDLTKQLFTTRTICWLGCISLITSLSAYWGQWFRGLSLYLWCPWLLGLAMAVGCVFLLVKIKLEQNSDTCRLNESLQQYQSKD